MHTTVQVHNIVPVNILMLVNEGFGIVVVMEEMLKT